MLMHPQQAQLVGVVFSAESFIQLLTQHHMTLCLLGIESRYHLELRTNLV